MTGSKIHSLGQICYRFDSVAGTANLRGTHIIDLAAALWRIPEMGSTIGIERTEQQSRSLMPISSQGAWDVLRLHFIEQHLPALRLIRSC